MLLLCAGMGCGFTAAAHIRDCQRQLHSLSRLFGYLAELLNAQALAGPELLHRAARCPEFADFCPAGAAALADLQLPSCLPEALRALHRALVENHVPFAWVTDLCRVVRVLSQFVIR